MKIEKKQGDTCPICRQKIGAKNEWVRYHISYNPCLQILACKFCNYAEFAMRSGTIPLYGKAMNIYRIRRILAYHERFDIKLLT